jgi:hypothetical protein
MTSWIQGFITAYNFDVPGPSDLTKGTDVDGLQAWMDNYCAQHPLANIADAAIALVDELSKRAAP